MKFYYYIMAHILHTIGHWISIPMCRYEWAGHLYSLYNWLMLKSCHYSDLGDVGLWSEPKKNDKE